MATGSSTAVRKAREVVRQARNEGAPGAAGTAALHTAPGLVLGDLLRPDVLHGVGLRGIADKVEAGERVTPEEGLWLLTRAPLMALAELANVWRRRYVPEPRVTYVVDTNPNYTNYCDADCLFCAFYRKPGDAEEGYAYDVGELMDLIGRSVERGATTVLLQGGLHDELSFDYYLDVVRAFRERFPDVHPHLWSAPEIGKMREVSGLSYDEIFRELHEAGQRTMPGGGAEILSDRVRARISPKKQSAMEWVEIHRAAHRQGFRTTATMMYGHAEQPADVIEHLEWLRRIQEESRGDGEGRDARRQEGRGAAGPAGTDGAGFTAFIPWSFKSVHTPMEKHFPESPGPSVYLRVLGVSRIYLDNFEHIQASWFSEGKKAGQVALHFGTDDFGGTLIEENVLHEAAHDVETTTEETIELIREAGFTPARRKTPLYDVVEEHGA